jgi:trehalose 6-phosphate synthase/phosphatase
LFHYLLWLDTTATVPAPDPSWAAYTKTNKLFAAKVAEIYQPGDLIIVHDYHLLLAPKLIREALGQQQPSPSNGTGTANGWGALQPSPAASSEKKKMDWETGTGEVTPSQARSKEQEASRLQKLGGFLGNAASGLGLGNKARDDNQVNEIMIGMFMHTPWPSSEIFRCLPSESFYPCDHYEGSRRVLILVSPTRDP